MALPFVADFTGALGALPDPPFKKWGSSAASLGRNGSGLAISTAVAGDAIALDDSNTYTTAQKSKITVGTFGGHGTGNYYVYALVNATLLENTGQAYWFWSDGGSDTVLNRVVAGSGTVVKTANTVTFAAGDTFEIANDGAGNITVKQNGSVISALSFSDGSPLTGGAAGAGVYQQNSSNVPNLTAWTADDVGAAASQGRLKTPGPGVSPFNLTQFFTRKLGTTTSANVTVPLTGVAGTGAEGTLTPAFSIGLTGDVGTGQTGQVADSDTTLLSGVVGTSATGTLTPAETVALTGVEGDTTTGTLGVAFGVPIAGVEGDSATGTMTPPGGTALNGVEGDTAEGTLAVSITVALTGVEGDSALGQVVDSGTTMLSGVVGTTATGTLVPEIDVALSGVEGDTATGVMTVPGDKTVALTGVGVVGQTGAMAGAGGGINPLDPKYQGRNKRKQPNITFKPLPKEEAAALEETAPSIDPATTIESKPVPEGTGIAAALLDAAPVPQVTAITPVAAAPPPPPKPDEPVVETPPLPDEPRPDPRIAGFETTVRRLEKALASAQVDKQRADQEHQRAAKIAAEELDLRFGALHDAIGQAAARHVAEMARMQGLLDAGGKSHARLQRELNTLRAMLAAERLLDE